MINNIEERIEKVKQRLENNLFFDFLKIEITEANANKLTGRIPFKDDILNPYKTVHGGVLYSLADSVAGSLAIIQGNLVTTTTGSLNYLEPAWKTEYIYCTATLERDGKHLVSTTVKIYGDDGQVFDNGNFTFFKSTIEL